MVFLVPGAPGRPLVPDDHALQRSRHGLWCCGPGARATAGMRRLCRPSPNWRRRPGRNFWKPCVPKLSPLSKNTATPASWPFRCSRTSREPRCERWFEPANEQGIEPREGSIMPKGGAATARPGTFLLLRRIWSKILGTKSAAMPEAGRGEPWPKPDGLRGLSVLSAAPSA